jgi:S-adenosylmethionine:tRNA-ribosyltransferase-isomerase (queuine synthetase)
LRRGDLLVFNVSRTLPAVLQAKARSQGNNVEIRLAERLTDGSWLALLLCQRQADGTGTTFDQNEISDAERFACGLHSGMILDFSNELSATVLERNTAIPRLWRLEFSLKGQQFFEQIYALGKPIRYEYVPEDWALDNYQTIYATEPGSAEMPSAGRAFSWDVMFRLKKAGVNTANIVLHTGLSSYMDDELDAQHPASEEEYFISKCAADAINKTRLAGGRVIAVGTTVVRTLESEFGRSGYLAAANGRTRLHIDKQFRPKIVDGLITGLHEPQASHLDLLSAFVEPKNLFAAYQEALEQQYLWHEFGDVNLIV